jgi:hypothetical protein
LSAAPLRETIVAMSIVADVAHFRADDCEALVLASLACPLCLHSTTVDWELTGDGYDGYADCACRDCDEHWRVYLDPWQALRLALLTVGR